MLFKAQTASKKTVLTKNIHSMHHKNILFIGLGGCAGRIVAQIKNRLKDYKNSNNLHYLNLDLEKRQKAKIEEKGFDESEYLFFGGGNPRGYIDEILKKGSTSEDYQKLSSYFPIDRIGFVESLPDRPMEKGAGRKRMVGRLLLYANKYKVENKINELMRKLNDKAESSHPNVVVISSCCGGTGSSVFYDILNLFASPSINLFPVVIGPSFLIEKNKETNHNLADKIKMNAMAFFEELNFYNRFPKFNDFSIFSNKSKRLNLRYILFFDNLLKHEHDKKAADMTDLEVV